VLPTRSRDRGHGQSTQVVQLTHVVEPRRVVAREPRDREILRSSSGEEVPGCSSVWVQRRSAGTGGGTPVGSGNLHNNAGAIAAPVPRISSSDADKSLHASGVKARRRASTPWRPVVRRPCSRAFPAHMSTTGL